MSIQALNNNINCQVTCFTGGVGGAGSSSWVDVPLTDTNPFDQQCMYRFVTQGQTYYAETVHEDRLYWIYNMYFDKANKSNLVGGIAPYNVATKLEKFCGGGSSSPAATNTGPGSACGADGYGMVMYQSAEYNPRKKQCCYIGNGGAVSG